MVRLGLAIDPASWQPAAGIERDREMMKRDSPPKARMKSVEVELNQFHEATTKRWDVVGKKQNREATRALLVEIYRKVQEWRDAKKIKLVMRIIRGDKDEAYKLSKGSSEYLSVLRCLYQNKENQKRMSDWASALEYAEYRNIEPSGLEFFIYKERGIDTMRRNMAAVRAKPADKAKKGQ